MRHIIKFKFYDLHVYTAQCCNTYKHNKAQYRYSVLKRVFYINHVKNKMCLEWTPFACNSKNSIDLYQSNIGFT